MKAERLERMRDDPYYLTDDRQHRKPGDEDLDSIPIVRLDDLPPLSQGVHSGYTKNASSDVRVC